ncbi:MAG: hypothetical protein WBZ36_29015 [Candidatus Nitrosopolaris sp.]
MLNKGAPIDSFGVGTELSRSRDDPAMNGVYKLVAIKIPSSPPTRDEILYKFKTSPAKRTYPAPSKYTESWKTD